MKLNRHKFYSFFLFLVLTTLACLFEYSLFKSRVEDISERTSYLFRVENQRVNYYLRRYSDVLGEYRKEFKRKNQFDPNTFTKLARQFSLHFKDVKAFNFVSSDYRIIQVFPEDTNKAALGKDLKKHPDPLVAKVFNQGLSNFKLTFLPPVSIYQGGQAVIFYMPIEFKGGSKGWFNVVLLAENLFKNYRSSEDFGHVDFLVKDIQTNRFFIKSNSDYQREPLSYSTELLGRDIDFIFNIDSELRKEKTRSLKNLSVVLIVIFFLVFLFFLYSKGREELYLNYINIRNESNLLKTLIHDISNPIQAVLLSLQSLQSKNKKEGTNIENLDYLIQNQISAAEIINTVRNLYKDNQKLLVNDTFDLRPVLDDVLAGQSKEVEALGLKIDIKLEQEKLENTLLSKDAFKNHVLKNILSNSIKFSVPGSQLTIHFGGGHLTIRNLAKSIEPDRFEELNTFKEQESTLDNQGRSSLGLGLFIAKVFCHNGKIKLDISQNKDSGVVTTRLSF